MGSLDALARMNPMSQKRLVGVGAGPGGDSDRFVEVADSRQISANLILRRHGVEFMSNYTEV